SACSTAPVIGPVGLGAGGCWAAVLVPWATAGAAKPATRPTTRAAADRTPAQVRRIMGLFPGRTGERLFERFHKLAQHAPDLFRIAAHQDRILDRIGAE